MVSMQPVTRLQCVQESADVRAFIGGNSRGRPPPPFATAGYDAGNTEWDFVRILVLGAGGIGCELLHLLALSGFGDLTVIDLDTIELSNLNRQFLFREEDIGQPKSVVAARRVTERCPGVAVTGIFGRIEDQSDDFYRSFHLILMGLDSVPARRWMNRKVAELATWEVTQTPSGDAAVLRITEAIPIVETGTEGLQGHVKLVDMSRPHGSCIECMKWMYGNRRRQVPMCTLENIPRLPEHCVLYAQFKEWPDAHAASGEALDGDNAAHIRWVTRRARARQEAFGIGGPAIDEVFTLGVVKNVVPAVSCTNAMVAGMAVTEAMKWLTGVAPTLDNYYLYDGAGISTDVAVPGAQRLGGSDTCEVCGPRPVLSVRLDATPARIRESVVAAAAGRLRRDGAEAAAREGTLSLLYYDSSNGGGRGPVVEVFLLFHAGSARAVPIPGRTLRDILVNSGAQALLAAWQRDTATGGSGEEAADEQRRRQPAATVVLTAGPDGAITMPVRCVP